MVGKFKSSLEGPVRLSYGKKVDMVVWVERLVDGVRERREISPAQEHMETSFLRSNPDTQTHTERHEGVQSEIIYGSWLFLLFFFLGLDSSPPSTGVSTLSPPTSSAALRFFFSSLRAFLAAFSSTSDATGAATAEMDGSGAGAGAGVGSANQDEAALGQHLTCTSLHLKSVRFGRAREEGRSKTYRQQPPWRPS